MKELEALTALFPHGGSFENWIPDLKDTSAMI
jgi:hypothetical protein